MAKKEVKDAFIWGTGRRKTAVARVRLMTGSGVITVNGHPADDYFQTTGQRTPLLAPFKATETEGKFDVACTVKGGGKDAQADAVVLGISRALVIMNDLLQPKLKDAKLLTRDPRMKERKKYGLHGARRGTQFSKR